MNKQNSRQDRFYDVFISFSHSIEAKVQDLVASIKGRGFTVFVDRGFTDFRDISTVSENRVARLRDILSVSTSLIYCFSNDSHALRSAWTPWELGFFDGAVSDRIGVYLADGISQSTDATEYFKGVEYLQMYKPIADQNLGLQLGIERIISIDEFLDRFACRSRRIDNTRSAFQWHRNLQEEAVSNPANLILGIWEWQLQTILNVAEQGPGSDVLAHLRNAVSSAREKNIDVFRMPQVDLALDFWQSLHPENRHHFDDRTQELLKTWYELMARNPAAKHVYEVAIGDRAATTGSKSPDA